MKFSIIIPTLSRWDLLKECVDSLISNTNLSNGEIIIVSNGCTDNTPYNVITTYSEYKNIHVLSWPKALGYAKAINLGASVATGEYLILLNNDAKLLSPNWLELLEEPFKRFKNVGITGPAGYTRASIPWLIFFCVMIKRNVYNEIGGLDELFGVGGGEDTDFCIKAYFKGYTNYAIPLFKGNFNTPGHENLFPIYHKSGATRDVIPGMQDIIKANEARLVKLYGPP